MASHHLAEARSLAYHRAIADALGRDPAILPRARARIEEWTLAAPMSPRYVSAWRVLLASPLDTIVALLIDTSEHGRAMRQTTPFAGALSPETRWQIFRRVREPAR